MKVCLGSATVNADVAGVWHEGKRVKAIWENGVQIWPDTRRRVRRIVLDSRTLEFVDARTVWNYAMEATAVSSSASRYVSFEAGGKRYCVNSGYGGLGVAKYEQGCVLEFDGDKAPLYADLMGVETLTFKLVVPETKSPLMGAETTVARPLNGTKVYLELRTAYGAPKTLEGQCLIDGATSGESLMNEKRWGGLTFYLGTLKPAPVEDTAVRVRCPAFPSTDNRVYFVYPYVNMKITFNVLSVE